MSETPTIYQAISAVMCDVKPVGKDSYNDGQKFPFRGIDDVMNELHQALTKHGVFFVPRMLHSEPSSYTTKNGALMRHVVLTMQYDFYGPAGDKITAVVPGEASDSSDKGSNKALSAALKYLLLQTFCIPTHDIAEADKETHERAGDKAAPDGWPSYDVWVAEIEDLRTRSKALDDDRQASLRAWMQAMPISPASCTAEQADLWSAHIDELAAA